MFTLKQLQEAQSKVTSGADFANYIQDLIILGVKGYDTFVTDGKTEYYGVNNYSVCTEDKYYNLSIALSVNKERFIEFLIMHQDGQTDYITFCKHAAQSGIAKWRIDIVKMTCTYFDVTENSILIEKIPV